MLAGVWVPGRPYERTEGGTQQARRSASAHTRALGLNRRKAASRPWPAATMPIQVRALHILEARAARASAARVWFLPMADRAQGQRCGGSAQR